MPDNDLDFIDRAETAAEKLHRGPMTTEEIANDLAPYGLKNRVVALEGLDAVPRGEIDSDSHALRRRIQLMTLRNKMSGVHDALRKARR